MTDDNVYIHKRCTEHTYWVLPEGHDKWHLYLVAARHEGRGWWSLRHNGFSLDQNGQRWVNGPGGRWAEADVEVLAHRWARELKVGGLTAVDWLGIEAGKR